MLGAMAMVYRAIRQETELRRRQEMFLAASSHELKSPLASLRLSALQDIAGEKTNTIVLPLPIEMLKRLV